VAEGIVIRPERDADHPVIAEVVCAAFVTAPRRVASFVERVRAPDRRRRAPSDDSLRRHETGL